MRLESKIVALVVALLSLWSGFAVSAQTLTTTLANFDSATGGVRPYAALVLGSDGNFYGTTNTGGNSANCGSGGCGTVFRVTPNGTLTTLVNFNFANGANPYSALVQGSDGNFYGTTFYGGSSTSCGSSGCGTVFRMTANGTLTTLVNFEPASSTSGGANPYARLVRGSDGNFYGTTLYGGGSSTSCDSRGCGTVFRMTANGTLTTLINLSPTLGSKPYSGLIQASDGNFYGTTALGGSSTNCGTSGCGTVFRLTPSGTLTTLLNFNGSSGGASPFGELVQDSDGNFYGTTVYGGSTASSCDSRGCGTVFRLTPSGLTNLSLNPATGGTSPYAGLVQGRDGNFYGTTFSGGSSACGTSGCGTVFRITSSGILTTLVNFNPANGGVNPYAGLVQGNDGNFYSTTTFGGSSASCGSEGCGTVFRLNLNLSYRFYPVSPCRIVDTRNTPALSLSLNTPTSFVVNSGGSAFNYSSQGGSVSGCGIPADAKAVFFNFVAVNPIGSGFLQAWPFGAAIPTASVLNYATVPNFNIANGIILPVCDSLTTTCSKDLNVQANQSSIQLVMDVVGYFK
jgi:uncharacterized repeat protein (TIGR03803 family)